jgi:hypothetical protein
VQRLHRSLASHDAIAAHNGAVTSSQAIAKRPQTCEAAWRFAVEQLRVAIRISLGMLVEKCGVVAWLKPGQAALKSYVVNGSRSVPDFTAVTMAE